MDRTVGMVLGALNLLLMAVCLILYMGKDRSAPEIILSEAGYVYEEGLPEHILLSGVSARDAEDGDITDKVVVEKVVTDTVQKTAIITYGVADEAGNVRRVSRTLEMPVAERPQLPTAGEAGNVGADTQTQGQETQEHADAEEGTAGGTEPEAGETGSSENEVTTVEGETGDGRPVIVFTSREIRTKKGETPDWQGVMGEVQDDKDSRDTLLAALEVGGEYDLQRAGEYFLTLTVKDSDGKTSNAYPMKLIVEE